MAKTMTDLELMTAAIAAIESRIRAAVVARRAAEAQQTQERQKLSASAWRPPLLAMAGHGQEDVEHLKAVMQSQPHLFDATRGYVHEVAQMIGTAWWAPGPGVPMTPMADRNRAEMELARVGLNIWTALVVAVDHAEETRPGKAFGPIEDQQAYDHARQVVVDLAERKLAEVEEIPPTLLLGHAAVREVDLEPRASLARRLVDAAMNPAPQPAHPLWGKGPGSPSPALGEPVFLGGPRFEG